MKRNVTHILLAVGLILMAATTRIINAEMHLYNLAPVAALGLFSGAVIKDKRYAFVFALMGQFIADLYFQLFTNTPGFYGVGQLFTYGGLIAATLIGMQLKKASPVNIAAYSVAGSTAFFALSNLGVFLGGMYGYDVAGFTTTYVAAIPFFKNTLLGDLIGSTVLFGLYFSLQRAFTGKLQESAA